jgi:hypothetical protein
MGPKKEKVQDQCTRPHGPHEGFRSGRKPGFFPLPRFLEEIKTEKKNKIYHILITKTGIIKKIYFFSVLNSLGRRIKLILTCLNTSLEINFLAASWKTDCPIRKKSCHH